MEYPQLGMNCEMQRRRIEEIQTNCRIISSLVSTPTKSEDDTISGAEGYDLKCAKKGKAGYGSASR